MPHTSLPPSIQYTARKDDLTQVIESDVVTGLSFSVRGRFCMIMPRDGRPQPVAVTYRVEDIEPVEDWLYECRMRGSDGSQLSFLLSVDDLLHNIRRAQLAVLDESDDGFAA